MWYCIFIKGHWTTDEFLKDVILFIMPIIIVDAAMQNPLRILNQKLCFLSDPHILHVVKAHAHKNKQ